MKRSSLYIFLFVIALVLLVLPEDASAQCAMCRASVESNSEAAGGDEGFVGAGLNTGILYLMTIPYILIGTVGFIWYRYNKTRV